MFCSRCRIAASISRDLIMKPAQRKRIGPRSIAAIFLFLFMVSQPAWAYLDPGTGSMIISAIVGLFATVGLAVKTYWYKIKAFLRKDAVDVPEVADTSVESERSADH